MSKSKMRWDLNSSIAFARSLANQDKIKVQMVDDERSFRPYSENGVIHMQNPSPENISIYEPELHRCISHNFKEVKYTQELEYEDNSRSQATHRLLTDYIAEKAKLGEYEGRDEILSNHRANVMSSFDIDETVQDEKLRGLLHTLTRARNEWQSYVHDDVESSLEKTGFIDQLNKCNSKEDLQKLIQLVETTEQEQDDQKEDGEGEPKDGEGEPKDGEGEPENGEGEPENGEGEPENGDGEPKDGEGEPENGKGEPKDGKGEPKDGEGEPKEDKTPGVGFSDTEALEGAKILGQSAKVQSEHFNYHTEYVPENVEKDIEVVMNEKVDHLRLRDLNRLLDNLKLSKKVKRHLLSLSQSSYEYGLKSGRLNTKAISRVYTSKTAQPRIYKKRNSSKLEVNTAVSILCDCSGSMSGRRYQYAAASCIATSLILQDLQINHEVIGFSTSYVNNIYYQFKHFNHSRVSREVLSKRFLSSNLRMGANGDGEALTYCMGHLLQRDERAKTLIILSDGSPAGSGRGSSDAYLKRIAKSIEDDGKVNLAAIGIQTDCVKDYYSNYSVVRYAQDLEGAILKLMSKNIIR